MRNDTKEDEIAGHIARMGEKRNDFKVLGGNLFESDDFAYLYVRGRKEIG